MKKSIFFILIVLVVLFGTVFAIGGGGNTDISKEGNKVGATVFPIYDITAQIAGDDFEVVLLLPAGASPHTFDPQPSLLKDLEGTNTVFAIGHGLDDWSNTLAKSVNARVVVLDNNVDLRETGEETDRFDEIDTDEHSHDDEEAYEHEEEHADEDTHTHGPTDPHYWLSVHNAKQITRNIAEELAQLDKENARLYRERAEQYVEKLEILENEAKNKTSNLSNRNIISLHDAWYYFADELNLSLVGTFEPSAGKEPTPQYLANLERQVDEHRVSTLFIEPQLSKTSVQAFANDHNLSIAVIDPLGGVDGRNSYIELMRYNIDQVVNALKNNE